MKNTLKNITSFISLLVIVALIIFNLNVNLGSGTLHLFQPSIAKAGNCPIDYDACAMYEFPDGTTIVEEGEVIVVTPGDE